MTKTDKEPEVVSRNGAWRRSSLNPVLLLTKAIRKFNPMSLLTLALNKGKANDVKLKVICHRAESAGFVDGEELQVVSTHITTLIAPSTMTGVMVKSLIMSDLELEWGSDAWLCRIETGSNENLPWPTKKPISSILQNLRVATVHIWARHESTAVSI